MKDKSTAMRLKNAVVVANDLSECWIWVRSKTASGYGVIKINNVQWRAHRASYTAFIGPIPDGMLVCHKCDTPACINPTHLFLSSPKGNTADMLQKQRQHSKLTPLQVIAIRAARGSIREIARAYGMHNSTISQIRTRKRWCHL